MSSVRLWWNKPNDEWVIEQRSPGAVDPMTIVAKKVHFSALGQTVFNAEGQEPHAEIVFPKAWVSEVDADGMASIHSG